MRMIEHIKKEGKPIPLVKGKERFFLKVFEENASFSADLWVFDTYPGERFKGLPIKLSHLSKKAASLEELLTSYKLMGFRVLHPYHKYPKWYEESALEDRINVLYRKSSV